jgi:aldehyde:ferredoxin oxidoreductase
MVGGYVGRILYVDLSRAKVTKNPLDLRMVRKFIGGRGLGIRVLYEELKSKDIDPYSPENLLIFATGPLTGTIAPSAGRYCVVTRSPLTGTCLDSHAGGQFGPELKYAGYDFIVISGRAKKPVYLWIDDENVELRDAQNLWGKVVSETEKIIKEEVGDQEVKIATIGPGGEKSVSFASILNELHRAAGRGGAGAVMGSKNLKAIAVRGSGGIRIDNVEAFMEVVREAHEIIKKHPTTGLSGTLPKYGTAGILNIMNEHGILPTRNFQTGIFEEAEKISGERMAETILKRNKACNSCVIRCSRFCIIDTGSYAGTIVEGPEYETCWSFGAQCGINCLEAIAKANLMCNEYGIDTISTGNVIGFAMECFENGLINLKDTEGIKLKFGDSEAMLAMVEKIALKEGFGSILAQGVKKASEIIGKGASNFAMHVKGMEMPAYDPRGAKGQGLAYATSNRGACHLRAYMIKYEILGTPFLVDPFSTQGKAKLVAQTQDEYAVFDSLILCIRVPLAVSMEVIARLLSAATGWGFTVEEIMKAGERIYNMERMFNAKVGFTRKDDVLPPRILKEKMPKGPAMGNIVELDEMLNEYYAIRGWNMDGVPTGEKLQELEIT